MPINGIDKLKRVIWRLQEQEKEYFLKSELEEAIMYECGIDDRTLQANLAKLKKLGWIRCSSKRWYINDKDYFF